jgi:hypothetical protein
MRILKKGMSIYLLTLLLTYCRNSAPSNGQWSLARAFDHCAEEFHIGPLNYLVVKAGRITDEQIIENPAFSDETARTAIIANFMAPLVLDRMIKDSLVDETDSINPELKAKDLVSMPASYCSESTRQDDITRKIDTLINTRKMQPVYSIAGGFPGELEFHQANGIKNFFLSLWQISDYFDNTHPEYSFISRQIPDVSPGWYTHGLAKFYGWRILVFQGQTVLWNCFIHSQSTLLLMKSMEKKVFVALQYPTGQIASPFDLNENDLLQSPLALAFLKTLFQPGIGFEYLQPEAALYQKMKAEQTSPYNFIWLHDLQLHASLYERIGKKDAAERLYRTIVRLSKDSLLPHYLNKPALASISYVSDELDATVPFEL